MPGVLVALNQGKTTCSARRSAGQASYLNAIALGKPVVVTDAPGVRDYVDHRRTGLIVPPGDPIALREAVNWTLAPETLAEALARGRACA